MLALLSEILFVLRNHLLLLNVWLSLQNILKLLVLFLLLLELLLLLVDFLSLGDQSLLDRLDFGHKFVGSRVGGFELPPSMHIHWVLELFRQSLHLQLGVGVLSHQVVDFVL